MNISFDKDKMTVKVEVQDLKDLALAVRIEQFVNTPEWQDMVFIQSMIRETMLDSIKSILQTETHLRMAAYRNAVFKGFDECLSIPGQIITSAKVFRAENQKSVLEVLNGTNDEEQ